MILEKEFIFQNKRLQGYEHKGLWLEIKDGICEVKLGAYSDGATYARDENAYFTWFFHDNAYIDKTHKIPRKVIDLVMLDLLKYEKFAWLRFKNFKGIKAMRFVYYFGVRLFGWMRFQK